jgi:sulfite reductase (ferredoxin)
LAERWESGRLRTTTTQNLVIVDVPTDQAANVAAALAFHGLPTSASPFTRGMLACTGTEFRKLFLTETKASLSS